MDEDDEAKPGKKNDLFEKLTKVQLLNEGEARGDETAGDFF